MNLNEDLLYNSEEELSESWQVDNKGETDLHFISLDLKWKCKDFSMALIYLVRLTLAR